MIDQQSKEDMEEHQNQVGHNEAKEWVERLETQLDKQLFIDMLLSNTATVHVDEQGDVTRIVPGSKEWWDIKDVLRERLLSGEIKLTDEIMNLGADVVMTLADGSKQVSHIPTNDPRLDKYWKGCEVGRSGERIGEVAVYQSLEEILKSVSGIAVGYDGADYKEEILRRLQTSITAGKYIQKGEI